MTKRALLSTVGDIVQQRRIDLATAYRLLCRFSLKDSIDSDMSVSLPSAQDLSLSQPFWRQPPAIASQSISTATVSTIPSDWVSIRPASPCARNPNQ
ncbi:hypothetical protein [Bradyrhizobium forestalis]|uniref:hypothetical protein n=1 Tax=Bradyrhizobium forestalis TaxID=1419263 RepID=UPI0011AF7AE3|nr:hypothetical protein [Bradyrhizobium forestalis]